MTVLTPRVLLLLVWPLPLSLATTRGISVDFSSSRYLDVSVPGVPLIYLCIQYMIHGSSPCVFPHSEICGYNAYLQLPAAYRSLSRPSSAPDAKAFTLCSFLLELPIRFSHSLELLEFQNMGFIFSHLKGFPFSALFVFHTFVWNGSTLRWNCSICYPQFQERPWFFLTLQSLF